VAAPSAHRSSAARTWRWTELKLLRSSVTTVVLSTQDKKTHKRRGFGLLRRIWTFLGRRRKQQVLFLAAGTLVGTFFETLSLGAVLPFMTVLVEPDRVLRYGPVRVLAESAGIETPRQLITILTVTFVAVALFAGAVRLALLRSIHHLAYLIGTDLSSEVYRRTLYQPLSVHVARHSSQLITGISKKVTQCVHVLQQLLTACTSAVLATGITVALLLIDPVIATLTAVIFGGGYVAIARVSRRRLRRNGKLVKELATTLLQLLQEGLGGIRDILLDGTQPVHCSGYKAIDRPMRRAMAANAFLAAGPRIGMEAFGISGIALLSFFLAQREGGLAGFLPSLAALALGAQRLLPAFQQTYVGFAQFVGEEAAIAEVVGMLEQPIPISELGPPPSPLPFHERIECSGLSFRYSPEGPWILRGIDLEIRKGSRVGFVGKTGGGKSTLVDLVMGLLEPVEGRILIDSEPVVGVSARAWRLTVAHVPQAIFLSDTSVAENIAFGVLPEFIDMDRVRQVAKIAHVADFIETLPEGYLSKVGERGVRLSGGQRQRLGIARALYKQAQVLVFDEATSALDNNTERELMQAINGLSKELTVLMIAHRLSTLENCDQIVVLDNGCIAGVGTYAELLANNEIFRSLASGQNNINEQSTG
jgi:ATP-binding cassette, subfamily B, bacterial PglK